jgi:hypothetical protein
LHKTLILLIDPAFATRDGFVKRPISALRFIPRHCGVPQVRLIPQDSQAVSRTFYETFCDMIFL